MNKYELKRITNAVNSLFDSTAIAVLFPGGVRVDVWGRNGGRPQWEVSEQPGVLGELGVVIFDNGKYSLAISEYEVDFSKVYLGDNVVYTHVVLPRVVLLRMFRLIYPAFLYTSPSYLMEMYFHRSVINAYLIGGMGDNKYVKVL